MTARKVVAVVGATGQQGGGLAQAILADPAGEFALRAITRNPDSEAAQALRERGTEVVKADLADEASLRAAFEGADAAYLVTNWAELMDPKAEIDQAHAMARAAKAAGVGHAIWSTNDDSRQTIPADDERYPDVLGFKVPHIDAKASADAYFTEIGVPTTFLRTSFFWDNLASVMPLRRNEDGTLALALAMGDSRLSGIAAADIGKVVLSILKRREEFLGRTVSIAGEHLTGTQMAAQFSDVLGQTVTYHPLPVQSIREAGFYLADDVANMFQFFTEYEDVIVGPRDVSATRELHPELMTFATWAAQNRDRVQAAIAEQNWSQLL